MFTPYATFSIVSDAQVTHCLCLGRKEILDGMLGANLVCFQARHIPFAHILCF